MMTSASFSCCTVCSLDHRRRSTSLPNKQSVGRYNAPACANRMLAYQPYPLYGRNQPLSSRTYRTRRLSTRCSATKEAGQKGRLVLDKRYLLVVIILLC